MIGGHEKSGWLPIGQGGGGTTLGNVATATADKDWGL